MEKQEQYQAVVNDPVRPADPPKTINPFLKPSTPPLLPEVKERYWVLRSVAAFAAGCCPGNGEGEDKEEPFDPGPIDSDDEPDLFPPDPHNKWVRLKREALFARDLEMADKIMAPVVCHSSKQHNPDWEPLSFQEVKELWQMVTKHGMGPLYSAASL